VTSDYDKIVDFFEEIRFLLEGLTVIEGRIPTVPAYKSHLMQVFASMLEICGFATSYIQKGQFSKFTEGSSE
jgi:hypothetical protein